MKIPTTWNESATYHAEMLWITAMALPHKESIDSLDTVEAGLQKLVGEMTKGRHVSNYEFLGYFKLAGTRAISECVYKQQWTRPEMVNLLCSKQRDYGHQNINGFGIVGVAVRMCDKIARLKNLTRPERAGQASNEPLVDTWRDIAGYATIALMLLDGTFDLELEEDTLVESK